MPNFSLEGLAEGLRNLEQAGNLIAKGAEDGAKALAERARDIAAQKALRLTGKLAESLRGGPGALHGSSGGIRMVHTPKGEFAEIGTSVFYGRFQESGTVNMRAHRFLRPAVYAVRRDVKRTVGEKVQVRLRGVGRRRK